jgi:hypothetical protein
MQDIDQRRSSTGSCEDAVAPRTFRMPCSKSCGVTALVLFAVVLPGAPLRASTQVLTDIGAAITGVFSGAVAWGDYDNDGDLDIVLTGWVRSEGRTVAKVYRNDGGGAFVDIEAALVGVDCSSAAWGDYDSDGDLDLLLTGKAPYPIGILSKIYRNDGGGVFTDIKAALDPMFTGSVAWGDYDNDGDLDIVLAGSSGARDFSKVYRNDGGGIFTDIRAKLAPGFAAGTDWQNTSRLCAVCWGDHDNDGDLDILFAGGPVFEVCRNDGGDVFATVEIDGSLPGAFYPAAAWGDYDSDGDLDILLTGSYRLGPVSTLYRNDGGGVFTDIKASLTGVWRSSVAWGDYDNDGDLDILLAGSSGSGPVSAIYRNGGDGAFADVGANLPGVSDGAVAWGDYDNDGDLDLLLTGFTGAEALSRIYRNDGTVANSAPAAPTNLVAVAQAGQALLEWAAASDGRTSSRALTYNLRIATTPGGVDISSPMAAQANGWRRIVEFGGVQHGTGAVVRGLPARRYYWSVQAIDSAFAGSPFAAESTFTFTAATISPTTATFPPSGGSGTIMVATEAGAAWEAVSGEPSWLWVGSGARGAGSGPVAYSLAANPKLDGRTGTITVAGQTLVVTQLGAFTDMGVDLPSGAVVWGDYDNDGDLDALRAAPPKITIERNDGGGVFTETGANLCYGSSCSRAVWGDYDNDGDLDVLLTGASDNPLPGNGGFVVQRNDGGAFVPVFTVLPTVEGDSVGWVDIDNDGDLDMVVTGWTSSGQAVARIYRNDGGDAFTDIQAKLPSLSGASLSWGDYDNDADLDLLITGRAIGIKRILKLYRNDGGGNLAEIEANLVCVDPVAAVWGDYDNDGDLDVLFADHDGPTRIYCNEGGGILADIRANLGSFAGEASWSDYDNDGDLDVLVTTSFPRESDWPEPSSRIFRNDGRSTFTDMGASLAGLVSVSASWGDYDNDGDLDVALTGYAAPFWDLYVTRIYRNECAVANTPPSAPSGLTATSRANEVTLAWNPATDDQTPSQGLTYNLRVSTTPGGVDIISPMAAVDTGWRRVVQAGGAQHGTTAVLNGLPAGSYYWSVQAIDSALAGSRFAAESTLIFIPAVVSPTSATFPRAGGSGRITVATEPSAGWTAVSNEPSWLFLTSGANGIGTGSVTYAVAPNPGHNARSGSITVAGHRVAITQAAALTEIDAKLAAVVFAAAAWGDYDNDGDLDILLTGATPAGEWHDPFLAIYRNDGGRAFTDIGASLSGVWNSAVAWGDYDNDGDLDILLSGNTRTVSPIPHRSAVYRNDGGGVFTDVRAGLAGVSASSVAWGDYDNDGDLDILLAGSDRSGATTKVYRNDRRGVFVGIAANLAGVENSSVAWGDYDNDGDLDVLLTGRSGSGPVSKIYRNDGAGVFADISAALVGVEHPSVGWGDYDNDGDLDIVLTGRSGSGPVSRIYRNDGAGIFTDIAAALVGVEHSSVGWGDYDNDGDLDILLAGVSASEQVSKIYRNDGGGAFRDTGAGLPGVGYGAAAWGDFDNDGYLDILLAGGELCPRCESFSRIYRSETLVANTPPEPPSDLSASGAEGQTTLVWAGAHDAQTPSAGLTYDLRISTTPGGVDVASPMAAMDTGWRRVVQAGGAQHGTTAVLNGLPAGAYYWSVQAIDSAFAGSRFAAEGSFTAGGCRYTLEPMNAPVAAAGGTGTIAVSAVAGCAWSAVSGAAWITVTSGASGVGNGSVAYAVGTNAGERRVGTIAIGGQTFTVTQESTPGRLRRRLVGSAHAPR